MKETLLEKYVLQQLDSAEKKQFEQFCQDDESFQQEVNLINDIIIGMEHYWSKKTANKITHVDKELHTEGFFERIPNSSLEQMLINGIEATGNHELSQTIDQVEQELVNEGFFEQTEPKTKTPIIRLLTYVVAAASIILVLTFGWQQMTNTVNPQEQFASHFEPYPDQLSQAIELELSEQGFAGNPDEINLKALLAAMDIYAQGNYAIAINDFTELLQGNKVDQAYQLNAQFYLGLSYLADEQPTKALEQFAAFEPIKNGALTTTIQWYTALAHLKNENIGLAKKQLMQLKSSKEYQEQATTLLENL